MKNLLIQLMKLCFWQRIVENSLVLRVKPVHKVRRAKKVNVAKKARKVTRVKSVPKVNKALKANVVKKVTRVTKVKLVLRVKPVHRVLLV